MGIHSVLFRIWFADDSVIEPSRLQETTTYTAFGVNAGIVRFHGYAGGFEAGVCQTLRVFALPPTAISIADLIRTAVGDIRDLPARALLNALLRNIHTATRHGMGGVDFELAVTSGLLAGEKAPGYLYYQPLLTHATIAMSPLSFAWTVAGD